MTPNMDDFTGGKALVYKSDNIYERRRRILREARKMISESGLAGFSVRELATRAGIAQKTLYNAFGSKDNVIALAIRQYMGDFNDRVAFVFDNLTLEGRLERLIKIHSRNIQVRAYTTAIMAVYNSPSADRAVREAIRNLSEVSFRSYAEVLDVQGAYAEGMNAERLIYLATTQVYAVLSDWCLKDLPDDQLVDRICETFLVLLLGSTTGETQRQAQRWLEDLRGARPGWLALRKMAEVSPQDLQPPPRPADAHQTSPAER
jgi:AcrR family transcriptional regulator